MWELVDGFLKALQLLASADPTVIEIATRSLCISGAATLMAASWGLPTAILLAMGSFRGREFIKGVFNAMLGVPTVGLGLVLFLLFSRSGPLGFLRLLYTPMGVAVGQAVLVTPIVVSFIVSAVESVEPEIRDLARTLGASELEASMAVLREARGGVVLALVASFNRAISELGVALMIGGNIRGVTRVLTTSIALETARGEIELSIALAIILLLIVLAVSLLSRLLRRWGGWMR